MVYEIACPECDEKYIGETARAMSTRLKEHLNPKATLSALSAVADHCLDQGHNIGKENVKIIAREDHLWRRKIKESIEIRTRQPTMNRDQGYDLPRIYDQLLYKWSRDSEGFHITPDEGRENGRNVAKCDNLEF